MTLSFRIDTILPTPTSSNESLPNLKRVHSDIENDGLSQLPQGFDFKINQVHINVKIQRRRIMKFIMTMYAI